MPRDVYHPIEGNVSPSRKRTDPLPSAESLKSLRQQLQILPITSRTDPALINQLKETLSELIKTTENYTGKRKGKKRDRDGERRDEGGRKADWMDSEG